MQPQPPWPLVLPDSRFVLVGTPGGARLLEHGRLLREWRDALAALDWLAGSWEELGVDRNERWIGYFSYDLGRQIELIPSIARDVIGAPDFMLGLGERAERHMAAPSDTCGSGGAALRSSLPGERYREAVQRCLEYIRAGDVFQVNLAQVFTAPAPPDMSAVFDRLNTRTPAPYAAHVRFGELELISNSPELFLRVTPDPASGLRCIVESDKASESEKVESEKVSGTFRTSGRRRIVTRPIKGTRPRRPGMDVELRDSSKDQAELNMIVDLERNDLGRVCEIGSVRVTEPRVIEAHPTVYHGVATIEGTLRDDVTLADLVRATFPGGSITGAPKIRAMQIIEELEPVRRGPYCGAIGWIASDGSLEFNVAIRTMIVKGGVVHVPVGGGIVADSDPTAEYEETLVKARAMFDALGVSAE